ncbi:toxin regulator [Virgibacillus phasianinus]|uniref:Toxin regulator n=1 Tax=Virgibacillus phasianinus TaxID=2017483 RepID=A0A220U2G7_9BACI|nr:toxin regulator [Virgibacillus phasianinus]ASK62235.1 toxin regulator [Virgibacillus phasianinus]
MVKKKGKKFWISSVLGVIIFIFLIVSVSNSAAATKRADKEVSDLESNLDEKNSRIAELEDDLEEKDSTIAELNKKVEEAEPWFKLSKKEQERKIAEEKKKEEAEKAAAAKKAAEEEKARLAAEEAERKKQEEKEKQGYETGITFEQLARTPDDYEGEKVTFSGKVVQVIEGEDTTVQLRIAVNDDYDKVIFAEYDSSIVDSRVLEDDQITIMGISSGLLSYESTMGGTITIPSIIVDKIEQ